MYIYLLIFIYIILIGLISFDLYKMKVLYQKYVNEQIKKDVVKMVYLGIEQLYNNLNSEEKLNKSIENINILFKEKDIIATDLELRMLIESTVNYFNKEVGELNGD